MKTRDREEILNELVSDDELRKRADNYRPDEPVPQPEEESLKVFALWAYSEEDPFSQTPIFEGTFEECVKEAEEVAAKRGFQPVSDTTVISRHWTNDKGDSLVIQ